MSALSNIVRRTLDHRFRGEVIRKARYKLRDQLERADRASSVAWCRRHAEDPAEWAKAIDADSWTRATSFAAGHVAHARDLLTGAAILLGEGVAKWLQQGCQRLASDQLGDHRVGPHRLVRIGDEVPSGPDLAGARLERWRRIRREIRVLS